VKPNDFKFAVIPGGHQRSTDAPFVPQYPWGKDLEQSMFSTKRGFVFQYPPFATLDEIDGDIVDERPVAGLYVHVPFCRYHCAYCYYAVSVDQRQESVQRYLSALEREMDLIVERRGIPLHTITTVFFGGGTPTYLDGAQIAQTVGELRKRFDLNRVEEFTVESDPTTVSLAKMEAIRAAGVNRVSIGVQSFSTEINLLNERKHSEQESLAAIETIRQAGIGNLNIDLICGLIGETEKAWEHSIDRLLEVAPEHVTIYLFSLRPQTSAFVLLKKGGLPQPPNEEERIEWMLYARQRLIDRGYQQTTPNCFVREPRFEQIHQRNAWSSLPLIGLGNSAYSFVNNCVTQNVRATESYVGRLFAGRTPLEIGTRLNSRDLVVRYLILRLKQLHVNRQDFRERFGFEIEDVFRPQIQRLVEMGFLESSETAISLTLSGIIYVDDVCRSFYSEDVSRRMKILEPDCAKPLLRSLI
jgi:oxygen-independent coproporphyrinogen-3 oxidase